MWKKIPSLIQDEARAFDAVFRRKAKLLIDENIGKLAGILKDLGWNAVPAQEAALRGQPDENVFALAWRKKRVLITNDTDFLDDRLYPFHRCSGVLIVPSPSENLDSFADAISSALPVIGHFVTAFLGAKIVIGSDGIWTVRGFSKESGIHWKARFRLDRHGRAWEWDDS